MTKYGGAGGGSASDWPFSGGGRLSGQLSSSLYRNEQQWSAMGRVLLGLRIGNMSVFRSAKNDWKQRYPNDPLILADTKKAYLGGGYTVMPEIRDAKIRGLTDTDLVGVNLSNITFVYPDVQNPEAVALLESAGAKVKGYTINGEQHHHSSRPAAITTSRVRIIDASGNRQWGTATVTNSASIGEREIARIGRYLRYLEFEPAVFKAQVGDWRDMHPAPAVLSLAQDGGSIPRVDFTQYTEEDFDRVSFKGEGVFKGTSFYDAVMPSVEFAKMLQAKGAVIHSFTVGSKRYESKPRTSDAETVPVATMPGRDEKPVQKVEAPVSSREAAIAEAAALNAHRAKKIAAARNDAVDRLTNPTAPARRGR